MKKHVHLNTNARVNGVLRSPAEGPIETDAAEVDRLVGERLGRDVTAEVTGTAKPKPKRSAKAAKAPAKGAKVAKATKPPAGVAPAPAGDSAPAAAPPEPIA